MASLTRIFAQPATFGREATAEDFGAAQGRATQAQGQALGQAGEAAGHIFEGAQQSKVGHAVVNATNELEQVRQKLLQDPDYETHAETFQKAREDILKRYRDTLLPGRFQDDFGLRVEPLANRIGVDVQQNMRDRAEDQSKANLDDSENQFGLLAAQASDPVQREAFRGEYAIQVRDAVRSGFLTAEDAVRRIDRFQKTVGTADRIRAISADPLAAFKAMQDPSSRLLEGLNAAEVAEARKQAADAYSTQLSQQRAAASAARAEAEYREREAGEAATRQLYDLLEQRDLARAGQFLQQARNVLPPDRYEFGLVRLAKGGGLQDTEGAPARSDLNAYLALQQSALAGTPIGPVADGLLRAGRLTKEDHDRLVSSSTKTRFDPAKRFVASATRRGLFPNPQQNLQAAEAGQQLDAWIQQNPNATPAEAMDAGRRILKDVGIRSELTLRKPTDAADKSGRTDINAAIAKAMEDRRAGRTNDDQLASELSRLRALESAQQMQGGVSK